MANVASGAFSFNLQVANVLLINMREIMWKISMGNAVYGAFSFNVQVNSFD